MPLLLKIVFVFGALWSLIYSIRFITFELRHKHTKSAIATIFLTALMIVMVSLGIAFF